jgi:hypothetical protein
MSDSINDLLHGGIPKFELPAPGGIFKEIMGNAKAAEERLLGPDYPYYKYIKTPSEIGMSGDGNLSQLGKDIDGLINYVEVLVTGGGNASATGQPLGNKFFLQTGAKCKDVATGNDVDRYVYIDNVPAGNIPFISSGLGVNFSEFKGLIPGTISNLNAFNPMTLLQAFFPGDNACRELTMETIDTYNNRSTQSHYVTLTDIGNMDPCIFPDKRNPEIPENVCKETFTNIKDTGLNTQCYTCYKLPKDPLSQLYFLGLGLVGTYVLYRIMEKYKLVK